jgi:transcription initiation factor TFIID subunit 1, fungi type
LGPWAEPEHSSKIANPTNTALESGEWIKSIIWEPNTPFRNFTQLELREVEETQSEYVGNQG